MKTTTVALAAAIAAGTLVHAQEAVQWRVEDGGNGHWYGTTPAALTWSLQQDWCVSQGGHLATLTSKQEWQWVKQSLPVAEKFVGASQDHSDPNYAEPSGGWKWVTGEQFAFSGYMAMFDDCPGGTEGQCGCVGDGNQDVLFYTGCCNNQLDDIGDGVVVGCDSISRKGVIEWSADCNGDGIVDYGQILDGTLFDGDNNGIPDCCELGYDCNTNLVINGSFEVGPGQPDCSWVALYPGDTQLAPWVVTQSSVDRQRLSEACTNESWQSYSGEFTVDLDGFSTAGALEQDLTTVSGRQYQLTLQLTANCGNTSLKRIRVIVGDTSAEFQTNCQASNPQAWVPVTMPFTATSALTTLRLESLSSSGINGPVVDDVRVSPYQPACDADINDDGTVNGADISVLLGYWGQSGKNVVGDITGDGIVNGADLALLLGNWGPCQ